jgi:AAA ATPase domain
MAPQVIGREAELAALQPFLDAVPEGPVAWVFEGEAGIGKTTLWQAGVDAALGRSFRVLSCRAAQAETKLPFTALGDLFSPLPEQVAPRAVHLEVGLVDVPAIPDDVPTGGGGLGELGREPMDPPVHRHVVDLDPSFLEASPGPASSRSGITRRALSLLDRHESSPSGSPDR